MTAGGVRADVTVELFHARASGKLRSVQESGAFLGEAAIDARAGLTDFEVEITLSSLSSNAC